MVDKRFPVFYSVLLSFFMSIMIILMILLFIEYRFFCYQVNQLLLLKQQYSCYIQMFDKKTNSNNGLIEDCQHVTSGENLLYTSDEMLEEMTDETSVGMDQIIAAESSDAPDNDDEYMDDSFIVINRHPDYLKQSTFDYMESQELNALMTAIDIDRWSDYTEIAPVYKASPNKVVVKKQPPENVSKIFDNTLSQDAKKVSTLRRPAKECGFIWPIDGDKFWISSLFGPRKRIDGTWGFHHGVDMAAVKGTHIKAVRSGTVVEAAFQAGYGNTVVIKHTEALKTRYAHLHAIRTHVGQKVKQGTIIGTVGETGFIRKKGKDGSHLHFEVYEYGKRINPLHSLPRMT